MIKLNGPLFKILETQLNKKFSYELKDAEYILKAKPDANTTVRFWKSETRTLPMSMMHELVKTLKDYCVYKKVKFVLNIKDERVFNNDVITMPDKFTNGRELRDYQTKAVYSFLRKKIGILQLGTGAGKSEIAFEIIRCLSYKTLFVVNKVELMKQTIERIKDSLGVEVGQYGSGIKDIKHITVATIQTLNKDLNYRSKLISCQKKLKKDAWLRYAKSNNVEILHYDIDDDDKTDLEFEEYEKSKKTYDKQMKLFIKDYKLTTDEIKLYNIKKQEAYKTYQECNEYLKTVRVSIFDECHCVAARSYYRLGGKLINTSHRLGLSATAYRCDGNDMAINASTGYKVFELNAKELVDKDYLVQPKIIFLKHYMTKDNKEEIDRKCKKGLINEKLKYQDQYKNYILENQYRNNLICDVANKHKDKKVIILVKLVAHGKWLEENIKGSRYLHGETSKKEREQLFNNFKNGDLNILISTVSILSEGIDIPNLNLIINAVGNKSDIKTIQILGRVLRKLKGKLYGQYIDFIDDVGMLYHATKSRVSILRKEGHEVIIKNIINQ
jgi:superfamily II DNA or RNA helicase